MTSFPREFLRNPYLLANRRAAQDAHRAVCDRDVVECAACREMLADR